MKKCTNCHNIKDLSCFGSAKHHRDGKTSQCNDCRNEKLRQAYKNPEVKKRYRNRQLKNDFGITLDTYNQMLSEQESCCATCNRHVSELSKPLVVDHDHNTGKVRGLLCDYCNRLLGNYENKPELFKSFDSYLSSPPVKLMKVVV